MTDEYRRIRPGGGYRKLRSFQAAQAVYDATVAFCDRFIERRSRTHDQMIQAARSGRQNIAEGSRAAVASSQTELRLTSVARASLDELLLDYEDFLRQRRLQQWRKDDPRAAQVRAMALRGRPTDHSDQTDQSDQSDRTDQLGEDDPYAPYRSLVERGDPETAANTVICLIHQANFLLDRQLTRLEQSFIEDGGYSERLAAARRAARGQAGSDDGTVRMDPTDRTDSDTPTVPECPVCGQPMVRRKARTGARAGAAFWGCSSYPKCKGTRSGGA